MTQNRPSMDRLHLILALIVALVVWETVEWTFSLNMVRTGVLEDGRSGNLVTTVLESTVTSDSQVISMGLCDALHSTPLQIWADHLTEIVDGLKQPGDPQGALQEEHEAIVHRISPRLPYFVQNIPRDRRLLGRIVIKAWKRFQYILRQQQHHDQKGSYPDTNATGNEDVPPTVKIVILGGSVTAGVQCTTSVANVHRGDCAWPMRLGHFINRMAGGTVVEVWNGAMGATDTLIGTAILKYEMPPKNMRHPDIMINAYSVNDNHLETIDPAIGQETALRDDIIFDTQQEFVRIAMRSQPCHDPPLLIFLDDYLGNGQREIMVTTNAGQSMQLLATYYGIGTVSYTHMIRDIVYKNTRETIFSPRGWYRGGTSSKYMETENHPPATMHVTVALSMSYYLLDLASTYCDMERTAQPSIHYNQTLYPDDSFDTRALTPPLSSRTSLQDISQLWRPSIQQVQSSDEAMQSCDEYTKSNLESHNRCSCAWMSGLPTEATANATIEDIFRPYLLSTSKWKVDNVGGLSGWSPVGLADRFVFETKIKATAVGATRSMTILYLKSWDSKWTDSRAEVTVWNNGDALLARQELSGYHTQRTSKVFRADLAFSSPAAANSTVKVEVRLVSGKTFKIKGLAICSD